MFDAVNGNIQTGEAGLIYTSDLCGRSGGKVPGSLRQLTRKKASLQLRELEDLNDKLLEPVRTFVKGQITEAVRFKQVAAFVRQ